MNQSIFAKFVEFKYLKIHNYTVWRYLCMCRLLVRSCLKLFTICDLTQNIKVEKQDNVNVLGQGQPHIMFLLQNHANGTTCFISLTYLSVTYAVNQQQHSVRSTLNKSTKKSKHPYIIFNDKTTREIWLKMILEMQMGVLLAKSE